MPARDPPRNTVLLDAFNIMFQTSSTDEEGNTIPDGNILLSAFECYEKLGYTVEAIMTIWNYKKFLKKKNPGSSVLRKLKKSGKLQTVNLDDDKHLLDRMTEEKTWLVTYDKFDDRTRDGKTTKRQRTHFPDLPWDEIDKYTRGTENKNGTIYSLKHWTVRGTIFYESDMPKAPKKLFKTQFNALIEASEDLDSILTKLDSLLEDYSKDDLPKKPNLRKRLSHMQNQALEMKSDIPEDIIDEESLSHHTVIELKEIANDRGISGRSNKKKAELIQMIKDDINPSPKKAKEKQKRKAEKKAEKKRADEERKQVKARLKKKSKTVGKRKTTKKSKLSTKNCANLIIEELRKMNSNNRPRKKQSLWVYIEEQRNNQWDEKWNNNILNHLNQRGEITISENNSIRYNI